MKLAKNFADLAIEIPPGANDAQKLLLRSQLVLRAALFAFADPKAPQGDLSIGRAELVELLSFSIAMLLAGDSSMRTRRDLRNATEYVEKFIRGGAQSLQADPELDEIMAMLGIRPLVAH